MTPFIYPVSVRPQRTPAQRTETEIALCPRTGAIVYVLPKFDHNSTMYCDKCGETHKVMRERDGVKLV